MDERNDEQWQAAKRMTTPLPGMPPERELLNSSASTVSEDEATAIRLIGQAQILNSSLLLLSQLQDKTVQFNSATPVMEALFEYALWVTVNQLKNILAQLKTLTYTLPVSSKTTKRVEHIDAALINIERLQWTLGNRE